METIDYIDSVIERLLSSPANFRSEADRAEAILREVDDMPSPVKEEMFVSLVLGLQSPRRKAA